MGMTNDNDWRDRDDDGEEFGGTIVIGVLFANLCE
jgi:hypothetical protein